MTNQVSPLLAVERGIKTQRQSNRAYSRSTIIPDSFKHWLGEVSLQTLPNQ
jgi:hypothetical protein